jgi:hypothetical protein
VAGCGHGLICYSTPYFPVATEGNHENSLTKVVSLPQSCDYVQEFHVFKKYQ